MKCPNCNYLRKISDEGKKDICPQCGLPYKKSIRTHAKNNARDKKAQEPSLRRLPTIKLTLILKLIGLLVISLLGYDYLMKDSSVSLMRYFEDLSRSSDANVEASWERHPPIKVSDKSCQMQETPSLVEERNIMSMMLTNTSDREIRVIVRGDFENGRYVFNNPKNIRSGKMNYITLSPNRPVPLLIMRMDAKQLNYCDFHFESESGKLIPYLE